jgi:hypothetical protein
MALAMLSSKELAVTFLDYISIRIQPSSKILYNVLEGYALRLLFKK